MKHKIQKVELFVGVIILLGGLLTYGLGVHQLLPVPRPDLVVYGQRLVKKRYSEPNMHPRKMIHFKFISSTG